MSSSVFKVFPSSSSSGSPEEGHQRQQSIADGEGGEQGTTSGVPPTPSEQQEGIADERLKIDSNLVIVVAKDGSVHVDQKTLHSLLANETNDTSVSVVRITSPTPSIEEEIAEERRLLQEQKVQQDLESAEAGSGSDDEEDDEDSDDSPASSNAGSGSSAVTPASSSASSASNAVATAGASKAEPSTTGAGPSGMTTRRAKQVAKKEDVLLDDGEIPHVSLMVEGFYPPEEAKKFASEVLTLAGLRKPLTVDTAMDYEFRRYVIANDHCYTPLTSPSQKLPPRPFFEDSDSPIETRPAPPAASGKSSTVAAEVKQPAVTQQPGEGTSGTIPNRGRTCKVTSPPAAVATKTRPRKSISQRDEINDAEDLQSILEDSDSDYTEESSYPDEDDNDSDVDFSIGGKKAKKRKSIPKNKAGSKTPAKRDDSLDAGRDHKKKQPVKTPKKTEPKLNVSQVSMVTKTVPKTYGTKKESTKPEIVAPAPVAVQAAPVAPVQVVIIKKDKKPPKPAPHEEALFTDMTSLFSTPDIIKKVGANRGTMINHPSTSVASSSNIRGFVQLSPANVKAGVQKLPAQISIQTHTSASEEHDKRLDLIDSIVQQEMNQHPLKHSQQHPPAPTPPLAEEIAKMLDNNLPPVGVQEPVLPITDNSILAALGSHDDGLPEDLLQHVAELAENKELQEILDKQVLGVMGAAADGSMAPLSAGMPSTSTLIPMATTPVHQTPTTMLPHGMSTSHLQLLPSPCQLNPAESLPTMTVKEQLMPRKEAIQIRRSDGRIITLPPIEAPATRSAKRRAQAGTPSSATSSPIVATVHSGAATTAPSTPVAAPSSASKPAKHSASATALKVAAASGPSYDNGSGGLLIDETPTRGKSSGNRSGASSRRTSESSSTSGRGKRQSTTAVAAVVAAEAEDDAESDKSWNSEDDPDRLWCICRQPHNNRFMICCDVCEDWFHGKCVNITKAMGQQMEADGIDWTCPVCLKKKQEKQQPKMTEYLVSSSSSSSIGSVQIPGSPKVVSVSVTACVICSKPAKANSVYCSDACIRKHAGLANDAPAKAIGSPTKDKSPLDDGKKVESPTKTSAKVGPIIVMERKTGRCLTGQNAPTAENLKAWLQSHPTFEVVPQGSPQAAIILAKQAEVRKLQLAKEAQRKAVSGGSSGSQHGSKVQLKVADQKKPSLAGAVTAAQHKQSTATKQQQNSSKQVPKDAATMPVSKNMPVIAQKAPGGSAPRTSTSTSSSGSSSKQQQQQQRRSVPEAKSSSKTPPNPAGENIRVTVKKTLKELLLQRTAELTNKASARLNEQEVEKFVAEIEEEMFSLFNKDTGAKYRAKYRSLVFNIKDRKNLSLFQKICEKRIEAKQLVRMTADELASQELAQWRENENKHQLEMIKKSELDLLACAKNYVLKTHKGEEVIEAKSIERVQLDPTTAVEDVVAVLNNSTVSSTSELDNTAATISPSKDGSYRLKDYDTLGKYAMYGSTPITSSTLGSSTTTTGSTSAVTASSSSSSKKKESKRDRSRSKSRERRRDRSRSRSKHKRRRSRSRSRPSSRDRERGMDRHRDHKSRDSRDKEQKSVVEKVKDKEASASATSDKDRNEALGKPIEAKKQHSKKSAADSKSQTQESFSLIDQILAGSGSSAKQPAGDSNVKTDKATPDIANKSETVLVAASSVEQDQEPSSTVTIPTPPHSTDFDNESPSTDFATTGGTVSDPEDDAKKRALEIHWTGNVHMVDVASVEMSIRSVSGDVEDVVKDFSEDLDICGTIKPEIVWDYIGQIRKSPNKEVCLVRFHSNEGAAYYTLYSHLFSRKRYSVIKSPVSSVKDFYIFPLPSEQMVPMILKPFRGVGIIEGDKKPDLLLGIIVKIRTSKRGGSSSTGTAGSVPTKTLRRQTSKTSASGSASAVSPSFALMQQVITKYATVNKKSSDPDQANRDSTPPGSPGPVLKSAKQLPKTGSSKTAPVSSESSSKSGTPRRSASESPDQVDMDIIKAPIATKGPKDAAVVIDDDDEPYSPGGASDDSDQFADVTAIVETKPTSALAASSSGASLDSESERIRLEMEEINRKIAEEKNEIVGILSKAELREDDIKSTLPPSLITDIAIPSNLSEILASIKGVPSLVPEKPKPLAVNEDSASASTPMDEDEEEYVPTAHYSSYKSGYSYGMAGNSASNLVVLANSEQSHASAESTNVGSKLSSLSEEEHGPG